MQKEYKYLYGPVPSRRLGRSLGVDIIPFKVCTLDCVYCQLGPTPKKTIRRSEYVKIEDVLAEIREKITAGLDADYITVAGSGEPTLNSRLGELLNAIKKITNIPLTVLTNGTLLYRKDVRAELSEADVVMPSLDAADERTFARVNHPHSDISIEKLVSGLCAFREEFPGRIWLEVFLVDGVNTDTEQIARLKELIKRIAPDKIHLNTAVRPTAEADVRRVTAEKLQAVAAELGEPCEIIADFSATRRPERLKTSAEDVFSMLKRRPCSLEDIASGLAIAPNLVTKHIAVLHRKGLIESYRKGRILFFKAT